MSEEQKKDKLLEYTGTYTARTFQNQGKKKDGTDWQKFKLTFSKDDKSTNFGAFVPFNAKSVQFDAMKEGQQYKILYKESPYTLPDGKEVQLKEIVLIYEAKSSAEPKKDDNYIYATTLYDGFIKAEKRHGKYNWMDYYCVAIADGLTMSPEKEKIAMRVWSEKNG